MDGGVVLLHLVLGAEPAPARRALVLPELLVDALEVRLQVRLSEESPLALVALEVSDSPVGSEISR